MHYRIASIGNMFFLIFFFVKHKELCGFDEHRWLKKCATQ